MRRAILHIGTEKTGSSSIQQMLDQNRRALRRQRIFFPKFGRAYGHTKLAVYAASDENWFNQRKQCGVYDREALKRFRKSFSREFRHSLAGLSPGAITVFSTEFCHSILKSVEEIRDLKDLLDRHFDQTSILVYLRRQDEMATSGYTTRVRSGDSRREILPEADSQDRYFNFELLLNRWSEVFGFDQVKPRLYIKSELRGSSVVSDFLAQCGLYDLSSLKIPAPVNVSLSGPAQEFLRQINQHLPRHPDDAFNSDRGYLDKFVAAKFTGNGRLPTRYEAVRFLANFLDSNERVRQQWFPDRAQLFSDAMDMYPLVEEPPPTFEHAVEIAVELWRVHLESAANKGRYGVRRTKTNKRGSHSMSLMRKGVRLLRKGLRLER